MDTDNDHKDMTPSKLVELAFDRDAFINTMWTLYLAAVAGVVALMAADKPLPYELPTKIALIIIFAVFARLNYSAIRKVGHQQDILLSMLQKEDAAEDAANLKMLILGLRLDPCCFRAVHILFDVAVVTAILAIHGFPCAR